jgi:hypothetical protein
VTYKSKLATAGLAALALTAGGTAFAQTGYAPPPQQMMISPAQGQTADQQQRDTYDCETGASSRSGWHPSQGTQTTPTKPAVGGRVAGAARGAARGAVREATSDKSDRELDNPSEAGARAGAAAGATRQRQARRENRQEQAALNQKQQNYYQQFRSCLQSRGYSVQ